LEFYGTETNQFYQIGNAVPPLLAYHLAQSVLTKILKIINEALESF